MRVLVRLVLAPLLLLFMATAPLPAQQEPPAFSQAELDQMLAPIALYPDALLSQILMAATYPLEVVQAARWSRNNPHLRGDAAVAAADDQDWDPSVKALVAFPEVLARMDADLAWTQRLGEAVRYQEPLVLARVQLLRQHAYAAGRLEGLPHARAYRDGQAILIEPANPRLVHVPRYHPGVVYGDWWWPAHPPTYWGSVPRAHVGILWSPGVLVSTRFFFSTFDWHHRHMVVHVHRHPPKQVVITKRHQARHHDFHRWRHVPRHPRRDIRHQRQRHDAVAPALSGRAHSPVITIGPRRLERERLATPRSGVERRSLQRRDATRHGAERRNFQRRDAIRSGAERRNFQRRDATRHGAERRNFQHRDATRHGAERRNFQRRDAIRSGAERRRRPQ